MKVMGNLPHERVTPARPIQRCRIYFFGPIHTYFKINGKLPVKGCGAIFICFATKAVHIQLVSKLTADVFVAAMKGLIGRHGLSSDIFCENATNFVGANKNLIFIKQFLFKKCHKLSFHRILEAFGRPL